jgi:hypothetical protein
MSRAYDNAADARLQQGGRRNLIINGAMEVAQRGTSVNSSTSSGYLTVDRFRANASGATFNMSQESLTVGQTDIPQNFKKFLRFNATTSNDYAGIRYYHEDVATLQGGVTVSFYAKGTNPADGYVNFSMSQNFGSGGSTEVENIGQNQVTLTSSWQRFTFNVSMPSISGKTVGTGSFVRMNWWQEDSASTDAWTIDITGVQLEYGNVATPFEHRSYGEELTLCQRYYHRRGAEGVQDSTYYHTFADGFSWDNGTLAFAFIEFPVAMRTAPSFSSGANMRLVGNGTNYESVTSFSVEWPTTFGTRLYINGTGFPTNGAALMLQAWNDADAFIAFDSEL